MTRLLTAARHASVRRLVAVALECLCTFLDEVVAEVYPEAQEDEDEKGHADPPSWYGSLNA